VPDDSTSLILYYLSLLFLLLLSALFSGTEAALLSLSKPKVKAMLETGNKRSGLIKLWLDEPDRILTTILVGNNLVNIAASALATIIVMKHLGPTAAGKAASIATGIMTFIILVFGEITPKTFARQHAEFISLHMIRTMKVLATILDPLVKALMFISNGVIRLLGSKPQEFHHFMTEEELKAIISVSEEEGILEEEEREMITSIFEFGETKVGEIMVPRVDMVCIDVDTPFEEVMKVVREVGHSRIPVYEESIDNIIGVLYVKDLLEYWDEEERANLDLRKTLRPPYFVPETKKVNELLREFQQEKVHIAIVVDEYGGTAGLVTIEDILEELVGEIEDEYDESKAGKPYTILSSSEVLVDGRMSIDDVREELEVKLPDVEDVETIAGFVISQLGHVPREGESVEVGNAKFTVVEADERRIIKLRLERLPYEEDETTNGHIKNAD